MPSIRRNLPGDTQPARFKIADAGLNTRTTPKFRTLKRDHRELDISGWHCHVAALVE
jgi:hypothetical protein